MDFAHLNFGEPDQIVVQFDGLELELAPCTTPFSFLC
jgi:hypothetical protein